jgi:hypothetical protein
MIFSPLIALRNQSRGRKNSVLLGFGLMALANVFLAVIALINSDR